MAKLKQSGWTVKLKIAFMTKLRVDHICVTLTTMQSSMLPSFPIIKNVIKLCSMSAQSGPSRYKKKKG
jgi:hypothetical protein